MRFFPYGKVALSFLMLSLISGGWIAKNAITSADRRTPSGTTKITFWVFAKTHYEAYRKALPVFEAAHPGVQVDMHLESSDGLAARLQNSFLADLDAPLPGQTSVGRAVSPD